MSRIRSPRIVASIVGLVLLTLAACGTAESPAVISSGNNPATSPRNLVETVEFDGYATFSSALAADSQSRLRTTLEGDGPYTLFVPSDAAFDALPTGLMPLLLEGSNQGLLRDILEHHVVEGQHLSAQLFDAGTLTSLEGSPITVEIVEEPAETEDATPLTSVEIGGVAALDTPDQLATNGVIHVIDTVLVPEDRVDDLDELIAQIPEVTDLLSTLEDDGRFGELLERLDAAGLTATLEGDGPFTIFAPTDDAFGDLTAAQRELLDSDPDIAEAVLSFHVTPRLVESTDLAIRVSLPTLEGQHARFERVAIRPDAPVDDEEEEDDADPEPVTYEYRFAGSAVSELDVLATNAIIHVVDSVLIPESVRGPGGL